MQCENAGKARSKPSRANSIPLTLCLIPKVFDGPVHLPLLSALLTATHVSLLVWFPVCNMPWQISLDSATSSIYLGVSDISEGPPSWFNLISSLGLNAGTPLPCVQPQQLSLTVEDATTPIFHKLGTKHSIWGGEWVFLFKLLQHKTAHHGGGMQRRHAVIQNYPSLRK